MIWGGLHGSYLILALVFAPLLARFTRGIGLDRAPALKRWLNIFITVQLVSFAWIFFRANNVHDSFTLVQRLFSTPWSLTDLSVLVAKLPTSMVDLTLLLTLLFMVIDPVYDRWVKREAPAPAGLLGTAAYAALLAGILLFGYFGSTSFIYFQF